MTTPSEKNGERLAVVEVEVKHLRQDLTEHREESKAHADKQAAAMQEQAKATNAIAEKMSEYQKRLAIVTGVFMSVVSIILLFPKLADLLRMLVK